MKVSWKIEVHKRDGTREAFDVAKLAGILRRVMPRTISSSRDAAELAHAIHIHLERKQLSLISSRAVFEMLLKALRRVRMGESAETLELHRTLRSARRKLLRVRHDNGNITMWDKNWLAELAGRMWHVSSRTAKILAGEIEIHLLPQEETEIPRRGVLNMLNEKVSQLGLADAVPLQPAKES